MNVRTIIPEGGSEAPLNAKMNAGEFRTALMAKMIDCDIPADQFSTVKNMCNGRTRQDITNAVQDWMAAQDTVEISNAPPIGLPFAGPQAKGAEDALFAKLSGSVPSEAARPFMGLGIIEMGECLNPVQSGKRSGLFGESRHSRLETLLNHSTSDFPNIAGVIGGAMNRFLLKAYEDASTPLLALFTERPVSNLRGVNMLRVGEFPALREVAEGGYVEYGTTDEVAESYAMGTGAGLFGITRKLMIDDDLGAMTDLGRRSAQSSTNYVADKISNLFTSNGNSGAKLSDGVTLFHTSRGNIAASGSAITVESLSAARLALRTTKGIDKKTPLKVTPRYIVCGPEHETDAERAVAALAAVTVDEVNPFAGKFEILVEPRLEGCGWYLFADPNSVPVFSASYLDGRKYPTLDQRPGWDRLGLEFRVLFDFGCGAVGWRGAFRNPGA